MIKEKNNFNFRKWRVFHELYKNETVIYYLINFCIMNFPAIARILFKIRDIKKKKYKGRYMEENILKDLSVNILKWYEFKKESTILYCRNQYGNRELFEKNKSSKLY